MVDWLGLLMPIAYLTVLVGSLATFSHLYRRRKAAHSANLEPWFGPHLQRNIYLSLLHLDPSDPSSIPSHSTEASKSNEKKLSNVPESIIKAALLKRAVQDISRVLSIRAAKAPLQNLLQQGKVGDELWTRFQRAEKDIELEVRDVVEEVRAVIYLSINTTILIDQANALAPNWGQTIFQSADQIYQNQLIKERLAEAQSKLADEQAWWSVRKQGISDSFMKELDEKDEKTSANSTKHSTPKIGSTNPASDDEAVLVDAGGPTGSQGSRTSSAKKKKGKK